MNFQGISIIKKPMTQFHLNSTHDILNTKKRITLIHSKFLHIEYSENECNCMVHGAVYTIVVFVWSMGKYIP